MFKLVLLYFELVAIFFDWDEVSLNEKFNDHAITVATCLAANCWRVTEASSCPYLAFPSKTETGHVTSKKGLVAASKMIRRKVSFSPYHPFLLVLLTCCGQDF
jgi:hypothetical protein